MGSVDSYTCTSIKKLIEERRLEEAYTAVTCKSNENSVKEYAWELLSSVLSVLFDKSPEQPNHVSFCESILEKLANTGNPQEIFVGLLEQTDSFNEDSCFKVLLKPLQISLLRLPSKRGKSLEWALNTVSHHVASLPLPQSYNLEGEEVMLMDLDPNVQRIVSLLQDYIFFFDPFVKEISLQSSHSPTVYLDRVKQQRKMLAAFLLKILHRPLIYLDLSCKHGKTKSSSRICCERVVKHISCLISNLLLCYDSTFLNILTKCVDSEELSISDISKFHKPMCKNSEGVLLALSNFAYLIFEEKLALEILPIVYTHQFLFQKHIPLISEMLSKSDNLIIYKGLRLFSALLANISELELPSSMLDIKEYFGLGMLLENIMIHCQLSEHRMFSLTLLSNYMNKFDSKGRHNLLVSLFNASTHSGFRGLLVGWYKNYLHSSIQKENMSNVFAGNNLQKFIMRAAELPNGSETDLLEHSDHIISVLNFVRYLALLKSQFSINNILIITDSIIDKFLTPLRTALDLSRAHYKLELQHIEEEKSSCKKTKNINDTVSVAGQILPNIPPDNQIKVLNSALLTFDVIESLLARVEEIL